MVLYAFAQFKHAIYVFANVWDKIYLKKAKLLK